MILVLDNRDSFVWNLVQALESLGAEVRLERASEIDAGSVIALRPSGVLAGPGPGRPERAGCIEELIRRAQGRFPLLGVCLGHQALATAFGGRVIRSGDLAHGRARLIHHDGRGVLAGLPSPFRAVRYNSLAVDPRSVPACLEVSARDEGGEIMGLRHRELPLEGVQFHPEAVLSEHGRELLSGFARSCQAIPGGQRAPVPR